MPSRDYWLSVWSLRSGKKSARNEDITFGQKKKKDINGKKNVRKTTHPLPVKANDLSGDIVARCQFYMTMIWKEEIWPQQLQWFHYFLCSVVQIF